VIFYITVYFNSWDKAPRLMPAMLPLHALNRIPEHIIFHWDYHVSFSPGQSGSWEHLRLPITEHPATAMVKVNTASVMLEGGKIGLGHWANSYVPTSSLFQARAFSLLHSYFSGCQ